MEEDKVYIDKSVNDYCATIELPKYKSKMEVGNIVIFNPLHFNWLQKRMWKLLLNIKITDIKE